MSKIELITRSGCAFCVRAKKLLNEENIPYTEQEIGLNISREKVLQDYPEARLLPLFILDGKYAGSYDELKAWVEDKNETNERNKFEQVVGMGLTCE